MLLSRNPGWRFVGNPIAVIAWLLFFGWPVRAQDAPYPAPDQPPASHPQPGGQPATQAQAPAAGNAQAAPGEKSKNDRMFFVMPNFLTVENEAHVAPIPWREKFVITAEGAFDPYEFVTVGILAGIRQAENAYPGFGQGFVGYAKRYGAGSPTRWTAT